MSDNKTIVQALYAAFGRGDVPFILANLDDSVEWVSTCSSDAIPWGGARHGQQGALSYFEAVGGNLDFEVFEPRQFAGDGELVFVRGRTRAKVKSTGRNFDSEWVHVFTLADGRVKRFQEFPDTAAILAPLPAH
jgi:ketosteroid isomerase-like protein